MNDVKFDLTELKIQRIRKGMTQNDISKLLGIALSTYSKKESGEIKISVKEFADIVNILKIDDISIFFKHHVDKMEHS